MQRMPRFLRNWRHKLLVLQVLQGAESTEKGVTREIDCSITVDITRFLQLTAVAASTPFNSTRDTYELHRGRSHEGGSERSPGRSA